MSTSSSEFSGNIHILFRAEFSVSKFLSFFIFQHLRSLNRSCKIFNGTCKVLEKSCIFVSQRMGTLYNRATSILTILILDWYSSDAAGTQLHADASVCGAGYQADRSTSPTMHCGRAILGRLLWVLRPSEHNDGVPPCRHLQDGRRCRQYGCRRSAAQVDTTDVILLF